MSSNIFAEGMPHGLVAPMYEKGYSIQPGFVDPEFAAALLTELKEHGQYQEGGARTGGGPGVRHNSTISEKLNVMPRLKEYRDTLNEAITEVSHFPFEHLTYLTVRVCPVDRNSSRIHRNDSAAGPWLITLTVEGNGSFNIYDDSVIPKGEERRLRGNGRDPRPLAASPMGAGDAWGIYSAEWSAPHAGGRNTSPDPKVLVMLYGWRVLDKYPRRGLSGPKTANSA